MCPIAVEYCIRSIMNSYIYRKNKDYYLCTLADIIKCFDDCVNFVTDRKISSSCDKCNENAESVKLLKKHFKNDHNLDLKTMNIQMGGKNNLFNSESHENTTIIRSEYYDKYVKYKNLYIESKGKNGQIGLI